MATRVLRAREAARDALQQGIEQIQQEQTVSPDFLPEVERAAETAAANPRLPDLDRTDLAFVTIDPAGSMDLDQAMHLEPDGDGYVVHYAIADVMAFVAPGDVVDRESHHRGESLYGGSTKIPLHPRVLSEGATSLLPDQVRPAFLWTIALDATGEVTTASVERARVRSTQRLDYDAVQRHIQRAPVGLDARAAGGGRRAAAGQGGRARRVSLPMPEQEIEVDRRPVAS